MSEIVIFCENYTTIKRTLYLATRNRYDYRITLVILGNPDLFKFFQVINDKVFRDTINLMYIKLYRSERLTAKGMKKVFHLLSDIVKERRYLKEIFNKYFTELEGCEVFFSGRAFAGHLFYLLKRLNKKNKLVYISASSPNATPLRKYTPTNIIHLAELIKLKLIYGCDTTMGQLPHLKGFFYIPDKFIEKKVGRVIDWEEMTGMIKDFDLSQFKVFDASNYSVIYFDQHLEKTGYVTDVDTYQRELTEVFNILSKYFPEKEIARKYHPNLNSDKAMIKVGDVIPDFIPAEFLYNERTEIYLGFTSGALANVEKGLAVSLIELVTFKDDETREQLREFVMGLSHSEILFPKSLDELEKIMSNLVKGVEI